MKLNHLRDVNVEAVSLVGKGANNKTFFLRKEAEDLDLIELPAPGRLVKAADWSAVYCVVAEPGWHEQPGAGAADQSVPDVWADEDEIRKAAHRFMRNGGLVNRMHESLAPYGQVVENVVAPSDFEINGQLIKQGSWYLAIEPTDEGREAIEAGTFNGVSIQGVGKRDLIEKGFEPEGCEGCWELIEEAVGVEKAEQFTKPGTANVSAADRKKLAPLLAHYGKKAHPFTACKRDQIKHGLSEDHANRRCAVLKQLILRKASEEDGGTLDGVSKGLGHAIAKKLGMTDDEIAAHDAVEKSTATFAQRIAQRELDDELPDAMDVLRSCIWAAYYPAPDDTADPKALISQSLEEFQTWALDLLDRVPVTKRADDIEIAEMLMSADEMAALEEAAPLVKAARKFSAKSRRRYGKKGVALPDGSFPIPDHDALKRAMKAVGRAAKSKRGKVRAHIRRRAKALKATHLLSDSMAKSDASPDDSGSLGSEMGFTDEEREEFDDLKQTVEELPDKLTKSITEAVAKAAKDDEEEATPTLEDVRKTVEELGDSVKKVAEDVKKLGSGASSQPSPNGKSDDEPVEKAEQPEHAGIL